MRVYTIDGLLVHEMLPTQHVRGNWIAAWAMGRRLRAPRVCIVHHVCLDRLAWTTSCKLRGPWATGWACLPVENPNFYFFLFLRAYLCELFVGSLLRTFSWGWIQDTFPTALPTWCSSNAMIQKKINFVGRMYKVSFQKRRTFTLFVGDHTNVYIPN